MLNNTNRPRKSQAEAQGKGAAGALVRTIGEYIAETLEKTEAAAS
jgi:hypothetical protein